MSRLVVAVFALALTWSASPWPAGAEIYRYTDERGQPHYVDGLEKVPPRYRAGAAPIGLRNAPVSASPGPAAGTPAAGASGGTTIQFRPGERILVEATVNGATSAVLLLDTGADRTLIAPRVLEAAGVSLETGTAAGRMQGVTGAADVRGVRVSSLEVGDARYGPLLVIAHDMDQAGVDGLLGRDFLEQFKVTIDSAGGVVTLDPK
jgi:predicted aspartyl protease